jgi:hypothetical protein
MFRGKASSADTVSNSLKDALFSGSIVEPREQGVLILDLK